MLPIPKAIYSTKIPSVPKGITFRSITVAEEKDLILLSKEEGEWVEKQRLLVDFIKRVVETPRDIDYSLIPPAELQLLFAKIRSKSISEKQKLGYPCEICDQESNRILSKIEIVRDKQGDANLSADEYKDLNIELESLNKQFITTLDKKYTQVEIDFDKIEIVNDPEHSLNFEIEGWKFNMMYAQNVQPIEIIKSGDEENDFRNTLKEIVLSSIKSFTYEDTFYDFNTLSDAEKHTWWNGTALEFRNKLEEKFLYSEPTLKYELKFKCKTCGYDNEFTITDYNDFFAF